MGQEKQIHEGFVTAKYFPNSLDLWEKNPVVNGGITLHKASSMPHFYFLCELEYSAEQNDELHGILDA